MIFSNWPLARRLSLAFAGVIGIFLVVIGVAIKSQNELKQADEMNQHTHVVLGVGQEMLQSMVNMETGARGFLLAGEERFLEPWAAGIKSFDAAWNKARSLTSDNPAQQKRLEDMRIRKAEFVSIVEKMQGLRRRSIAVPYPGKIFWPSSGKAWTRPPWMDSVRSKGVQQNGEGPACSSRRRAG